MKTIKINRDTIRITEPEIRGLRAIKAAGYVALEGDLYERRRGGYGTSLLPQSHRAGGRPTRATRQWELLGLHRQDGNTVRRVGLAAAERSLRGVTKSSAELKRVLAFFARHPRARHAVVGDPRRMNAILRKLDATR
jgi:hypothetical protein